MPVSEVRNIKINKEQVGERGQSGEIKWVCVCVCLPWEMEEIVGGDKDGQS